MHIFDSHTHLNQASLYSNREEHLSSFLDIGGKGLVNAGANGEYNKNGIEISRYCKKKYPNIFVKCVVGYHPCDVGNICNGAADKAREDLQTIISENKEEIVGVGECGIDLHFEDNPNITLQKNFFKMQCEVARDNHLPIVIHSRDAFDETFSVLQDFSDEIIYLHCWGYGKKELEQLLKTFSNLYVGFCGNVTYPSAENLRESLAIMPIEKLLIETDAPYLSPQGFRGKCNSPERVSIIGKYVAQQLEIDEQKFWEQIEENFFRLYGGEA